MGYDEDAAQWGRSASANLSIGREQNLARKFIGFADQNTLDPPALPATRDPLIRV